MEILDEIDTKILNILQQDARITNRELAAMLGMSTTPIFERIKKLEKKGFIKKYVALADGEMLGKDLLVFLFVSTKAHSHDKVKIMFREIECLPEVMECFHVSGDYDYLVKVVVGSMAEYERFLLDKITRIENVAHVKSIFSLSTVKYTTSFDLPLPGEAGF